MTGFDPGVFFILKPDAVWERHCPSAALRHVYQAEIVLKLNEDGTGHVLKNCYADEPRLSETWTKDEMLMVALKSKNI